MISYVLEIQTNKNINQYLFTNDFINKKNYWYYKISRQILDSNGITDICLFTNKYLERLLKLGIKKDDISFWIYYEYTEECILNFFSRDLKKLANFNFNVCINCWKKSDSELIFPCDLSDSNERLILKVNTVKDLSLISSENVFIKRNNSWYFETNGNTIHESILQIKSIFSKYLKIFLKNGISKGDILITYYYEYIQQCGIEFSPKLLKIFSKLDVNFQIICREKIN